MIRIIKRALKNMLPVTIRDKIIHRDEYLGIISIQQALKDQKLFELYNKLCSLVPDIINQYTIFKINTDYYKTKVRGEHAFQIFLVQQALKLLRLEDKRPLTIVDIGDSCGTHLQYLKGLYKDINTLSVNLDSEAVRRIREKGMDAICARAEELSRYSKNADIYLSFEMLEHLTDPIGFLHKLSSKTECKAFVVTVPYLAQSRVGLHFIRDMQKKDVYSENVHIFELSPFDWKLIFKYTGWDVIYDRIYLQYPKKGLLKLTKGYWKKIDYEGFYGAVLSRNFSWSSLYKDWS